VNPTGHPFRFNIGFFINQPIGYTRDIPFEFDHYVFDEDFQADDVHGALTLSRTQTGLRLDAGFKARVPLECARCLESFPLQISTQFEEIFTFENRPLSEDELIIPEDRNIDFVSYVRDYLLLEVPIRPLCKPDCKGLCEVCGENRNLKECGHTQQKSEPDPPGATISQRIQAKKKPPTP
jgi:uncharacterized protein